jgi:hypothetical protein
MGVVREARLKATPREVLQAIDGSLGRSDDVFIGVREIGGKTAGLAVYEQYFARVSNRIALTLMVDDFSADGTSLVRVIVTGSSRGLFINIDWGAAGDYAGEAVRIITDLARDRGGLLTV